MNNDVDLNEEVELKNQELLLNNRIKNLENSLEAFIAFFNNYSTENIPNDVNNQVCLFQNIDSNSEQGQIFRNLITTFFSLVYDETKKNINLKIELLKSKIDTITENEYNDNLKLLPDDIVNQTSKFYLDKLKDLTSEIIQTDNIEVKEKINNYLINIILMKMLKVLKENILSYIRVIDNNNKESKEVINRINEKTKEVIESINEKNTNKV